MTSRAVLQNVDFGEAGEKEVDFKVDYTPAEPPSGMSGPWEHSHPGVGSEVEIVAATLAGHDVLWLFDGAALEKIADDIRAELDDEAPDFEEPEDRMAA